MKKDQFPKKPIPAVKKVADKKPGSAKSVPLIPKVSNKANRYFVLAFFLFAFLLYGNTIFNK